MTNEPRFHSFLHKQIPIMIILSIFPGLGYVFLGYLHDTYIPALIWYCLILLLSLWGFHIYRSYQPEKMGREKLAQWYRVLGFFFYGFFILWVLIFLIYVREDASKLHYIAIFTEIGAAVVAASLLYPDRRLYRPTLLLLMLPLIIYFALIAEWYGYVLSIFSVTFTWVLFYAAGSSYELLMKTQYQASHDQLTGINNRQYFIGHLQQLMNSLHATNNYSYLLLIDLDHFKTINDSLGHDIGDALLKEVSIRLRSQTTQSQILARLGGDEFIIVGNEYDDKLLCEEIARSQSAELLSALKQSYLIEGHHLYISCSIGISLISADSINAQRFIKEADIAMYEVKASGRDGVFLFSDEMSARVEKNLEIERLLHFALENNEITLHFQPQLNAEREVVGAEVLVRWNNEKLGMVSPAEFIPIAEKTGLIVELGNYIMEQAFIMLRQWHETGLALQQLSINVSMRQFIHHNFVSDVKKLGYKYLSPELLGNLMFEVTESLELEDVYKTIDIMKELNELGIRFSLDDFGTGYSSLNYLKKLPIDELKIDREFIRDLSNNDDANAMVVTILNISRFLGLTVVAEGVESEEQFSFLRDYRCELYQGYLFSRPLPADQFENYCRRSRRSVVE
jgi:diguanylate cyclase (GGDEF)-like protein